MKKLIGSRMEAVQIWFEDTCPGLIVIGPPAEQVAFMHYFLGLVEKFAAYPVFPKALLNLGNRGLSPFCGLPREQNGD